MDIALIGLAVMGQNLVLNMESQGFSVAVYNRTSEKTYNFMENKGFQKNIRPAYSLKELVEMLKPPKKVIVMVKAGQAVDAIIDKLLLHMSEGDVIIDGGNSHYNDTDRRYEKLKEKNIFFLGTGISGGEEGALLGPSIMPGGDREGYDIVKDILKAISAKVNNIPCCTYIGDGSAGHFVKMVHNGIEYADMQIIVEAYDFLKRGLNLSIEEIGEIFQEWKEGELNSYLMDITSEILMYKDKNTKKALLEFILDKASQKGTGKWTSQAALDLAVPAPAIEGALFARNISALKEERLKASKVFKGSPEKFTGNKDEIIKAVYDGLFCSKITAYAQGLAILQKSSEEYNYNLELDKIAQIWKGGCIIKAKLLEPIKEAFKKNPSLKNLYMDENFSKILKEKEKNWRLRVVSGINLSIPCPVTVASLQYYDSYRSERLPANLIQAQRDYFGAHTYERIDKEGTFHTGWAG